MSRTAQSLHRNAPQSERQAIETSPQDGASTQLPVAVAGKSSADSRSYSVRRRCHRSLHTILPSWKTALMGTEHINTRPLYLINTCTDGRTNCIPHLCIQCFL